MFLSQLIGKQITSGKSIKGVCKGVGISLKNYAIKYLLCASSTSQNSSSDFAVNFGSVSHVENCIILPSLRTVAPKNCIKLFLGLPVFSCDGNFVGNLQDVEVINGVFTRFFVNENTYPITAIAACGDAIILKKEQPYPLGQRISAPCLCHIFDKNPIVTKPVLRTAIANGKLIKLTLSLSPFFMQTNEEKQTHKQSFNK